MNKLLGIAIEASLQAGKAIMEIYSTAFNVELKSDKSPITEADKYANTIINSILESTNLPILSEENKQIDFSERSKWNTFWIVDPVDGTKEFIKRNGEFTVNIALVTEGKPLLGVIYVPDSKTLYIGDVENKQAFKTYLNSHDTTLEEVLKMLNPIQPKTKNENTIRVVGSRSHMNAETQNYIAGLKQEGKTIEIIPKGSSLKFCLVAEGKADLYPRFSPTMEWDTAAGQAICEAVGLQVISQTHNASLRYNKHSLVNPWFMVINSFV